MTLLGNIIAIRGSNSPCYTMSYYVIFMHISTINSTLIPQMSCEDMAGQKAT